MRREIIPSRRSVPLKASIDARAMTVLSRSKKAASTRGSVRAASSVNGRYPPVCAPRPSARGSRGGLGLAPRRVRLDESTGRERFSLGGGRQHAPRRSDDRRHRHHGDRCDRAWQPAARRQPRSLAAARARHRKAGRRRRRAAARLAPRSNPLAARCPSAFATRATPTRWRKPLGLKGFSTGDMQAIANAVAAHVNRMGGVGGRQMALVFADYDATAATRGTGPAEDQKTCSTLTEDNHVFATLSPLSSGETLQTCLAQPRRAVRGSELRVLRHGRAARLLRARLPGCGAGNQAACRSPRGDRGSSAPTRRSGSCTSSAPTAVEPRDKGLRPALAAHGMKIADEISYTVNTPDAVTAGVLRFKSEGITHVFVLDVGGIETQYFMVNAESQSFRPRYAIDTRSNPVLQESNSPARQLVGAPRHRLGAGERRLAQPHTKRQGQRVPRDHASGTRRHRGRRRGTHCLRSTATRSSCSRQR